MTVPLTTLLISNKRFYRNMSIDPIKIEKFLLISSGVIDMERASSRT